MIILTSSDTAGERISFIAFVALALNSMIMNGAFSVYSTRSNAWISALVVLATS